MSQNLISVEICNPEVVQSFGRPALDTFSSSTIFYLSLSLLSIFEAIDKFQINTNIRINIKFNSRMINVLIFFKNLKKSELSELSLTLIVILLYYGFF